jgi:hypothetical protein
MTRVDDVDDEQMMITWQLQVRLMWLLTLLPDVPRAPHVCWSHARAARRHSFTPRPSPTTD